MGIVCKVEHCENTRDGRCQLEEATIEFNWDYEAYGAYCSNFKESKEYRKKTYLLHELDKNVYLAIRKNSFYDVDIEMIVDDIKPTEDITLIIDNYLYVGSSKATNRFMTVTYSVKEEDIVGTWVEGNIREEYLSSIKKYTCDYIRASGNTGTIVQTAIKMINKGINL